MSGQNAPPRSKASAKKRAKKPSDPAATAPAPTTQLSNPASVQTQFVTGGLVGGGVTIHHPGLKEGASEDEIEVGVSISTTRTPEDLFDPRFRDLNPQEQLSYLENFALPGLPGAYPTDIHTETYYEDIPAGQQGQLPLPLSFAYPNATGQTAPNGNWLNGNAFAGIAPALNITHEDLVQAANELYRRMADPEYGMEDPYWANLTPNLRAFVREAVPMNTQNRANGVAPNTHDIHAMAQRIVKAASEGMNLDKGLRAGMMAGVNGGHQQLAREMGFHPHPDAKEDEFEDDEELDLEDPEYAAAPNGDAPKKKNKKKKKKSAAAQTDPLPPAPLPPPPVVPQTVRPPVKQPPPRQPVPTPQTQQPALNPPPPPTIPAPVQPAPTSRAAGKKPMANPPANQPARSAKAAGKEPAAANGTGHHHHNHATTTSKTTSAKGKAPANAPPAKIWTQSSAEDRDNIRGYWLALSEDDRRGLLRVEKEAVLRKMKEHHRTACGCAICGRKKINIEMELDQLYEQYYSELRSYAAEQRLAVTGQRPPPAGAGPFPGSVEVDTAGQVIKFDHLAPDPRDELDEEGSEEYDDEEYDDDEELDDDDIASDEAQADEGDDRPPASHPHGRRIANIPKSAPRPDGEDFLGFGTGLATIKGGILTVADDLLKNDGGKFLDMMEQLAVARSFREEQNIREMEEPENDLDDDKEEPVTEEERMEEGKRMFQIFAARMFEQRVLQSYRERVAKQREEQLLRELEEEENEKKNKEEKKAKEAQKKKDKKRLQKEKAEKEKAEKDAEAAKAAAEAKAKKEEEERERNKKLEEDRMRREAVKKAAAEEQARQAAERRKRQQEEKEREEEAARKRREKEDKAKREREAREKEVKERERREKEERLAKEKAEKDRAAKEKADKAERDRIAKEQAAAAAAAAEAERVRMEEERKKEEAAKREREAAEQAKALRAQAEQRAKAEKAAADKAAAERAAAEKRAAAAAAAAANAAASSSSSVQRKPSRNGPTPHTTPPDDLTRAPGAAVRPGKTPQPFLPQPVPVASYPTRMPVGPSFTAPGFRPQFPPPGTSPVFSPPTASTHPSSISPNPPARGFGAPPSPPAGFDHPRTAPIGMGYPMKPPSGRVMSLEETFSPPSAPIGMSSGRNISAGDLNSLSVSGLSLEDGPYRRGDLSSLGAPGAPGAGSIGRPPISSSSSAAFDPHHHTRVSTSPPGPGKILGSAALLSTDDEIVQPASTRRANGGWDNAPLGAPPGLGGGGGGGAGNRWSAAPTIWSNAPEVSGSTPWGMPTIGESRSASGGVPGQPSAPVGAPGAGAPGQAPGRNPSFSMGGFGGAFGGGLFSSGAGGGTGSGQGQGHH